MFVNIIESYRKVVAICDSELIGKTFYSEDGKRQLYVKENFYKSSDSDEKVSEEEVRKIIQNMRKEDATFNIVGKRSVKIALEESLIQRDGVLEIEGIPFALILG
jgi:hypothetical protein